MKPQRDSVGRLAKALHNDMPATCKRLMRTQREMIGAVSQRTAHANRPRLRLPGNVDNIRQ